MENDENDTENTNTQSERTSPRLGLRKLLTINKSYPIITICGKNRWLQNRIRRIELNRFFIREYISLFDSKKPMIFIKFPLLDDFIFIFFKFIFFFFSHSKNERIK